MWITSWKSVTKGTISNPWGAAKNNPEAHQSMIVQAMTDQGYVWTESPLDQYLRATSSLSRRILE
jgi:hypothetical protein